MKYILSVVATSVPGELMTWVSTHVDKVEATGDGLTTSTVFAQRRELIWDTGQDFSLKQMTTEAVKHFITVSGIGDDF